MMGGSSNWIGFKRRSERGGSGGFSEVHLFGWLALGKKTGLRLRNTNTRVYVLTSQSSSILPPVSI